MMVNKEKTFIAFRPASPSRARARAGGDRRNGYRAIMYCRREDEAANQTSSSSNGRSEAQLLIASVVFVSSWVRAGLPRSWMRARERKDHASAASWPFAVLPDQERLPAQLRSSTLRIKHSNRRELSLAQLARITSCSQRQKQQRRQSQNQMHRRAGDCCAADSGPSIR